MPNYELSQMLLEIGSSLATKRRANTLGAWERGAAMRAQEDERERRLKEEAERKKLQAEEREYVLAERERVALEREEKAKRDAEAEAFDEKLMGALSTSEPPGGGPMLPAWQRLRNVAEEAPSPSTAAPILTRADSLEKVHMDELEDLAEEEAKKLEAERQREALIGMGAKPEEADLIVRGGPAGTVAGRRYEDRVNPPAARESAPKTPPDQVAKVVKDAMAIGEQVARGDLSPAEADGLIGVLGGGDAEVSKALEAYARTAYTRTSARLADEASRYERTKPAVAPEGRGLRGDADKLGEWEANKPRGAQPWGAGTDESDEALGGGLSPSTAPADGIDRAALALKAEFAQMRRTEGAEAASAWLERELADVVEDQKDRARLRRLVLAR